ncbi:uncharacterized protein FIBRA_04788 [Fibroporia radiculosa]|uniref:Cytochrome P450 n=1 Tax=Fibroporia radiculosa TaxID=599839 RepID=J4HWQ7_9APHY|nr:uncharacterized protein FIBRA_04788 [Fibroporia radiculosa]CCM02682.1 predicted protein [Fibroporia radiculosa]
MGAVLAVLGLGSLFFLWTQLIKPQRTLPPGPKPLPLVGNITNLTIKELWLRVTQWAQQYGDVVYVHVFGQGLVFLNTYDAAVDLLEKRGAIYSDKPGLIMTGELCGCENMVAFTRYGDKARRQRRLMQQALSANSVRRYEPLMAVQTQELLRNILLNPEEYIASIRRYAGGLTLSCIYGYQVRSNDDKFLTLAEECVDLLANKIASGGGIWPVDVLPFLRHMPDWMPGAGFKRSAAQWKAKIEEFVDKPYEYVKESMRNGTALPCFCTTLLEEMQERCEKEIDAERDFDIRWAANSMYSASIDTTLTVVMHFMLAMIKHPDVLAKAQAELDSVVGSGRLPTMSDRPALPYLECVMSEVLRWGAAVPMSLPHRLMEDDVYNGMHIPKGSLVFANVWNMVRDPALFPDPHAFTPERYLAPAADEATARRRDPRNYVFGFGRRRCPGLHLIESSLWMVMAAMVATLDLSVALDAQGYAVEPTVEFQNAVFRTPSAFKCDIRPRSEQAVRLVREAVDA